MHLSSTLGLVSFALLSLTSSATAEPGSLGIQDVSDDIKCPKGYSPTFLHNAYTYNGALKQFTDITGSFFNNQWYANATVVNTTGTDNVPGATRAGLFGVTPFNETLTTYLKHPDGILFTLHGNLPLVFERPGKRPLNIVRSSETKRFQSICGGKATYIDLITYQCSDDQAAAYDLFYNVHNTVFQNLAATIGTTLLAGDCPGM
ncbi:hypothetical protein B0H19DRAFT_925394 [Mycena capillaripes]|nr:hypothetical protein B0H19DRAFT_925394 [Mycena capillaripes]